jgi:hypothetical protein
MFISNKEKSDINEKMSHNKGQIENLVKHVAKLQVDIAKTEVDAIDDLLNKYLQLQKMYWGADKKVKTFEKQINEVQVQNIVLTKRSESMLGYFLEVKKRLDELESKKSGRPVGAKNRIVIPPETVQALKNSGVWDDPIKRINSIDQLIKEELEKKEEARRQKQRDAGKKYYAKKKAEKVEQKELL